MPPAISPKKTARRHHPAQPNARPHRPIHPSPNPPSQQSQSQSYTQRDMAATSSSHYTSYPGPYVQPRQLGSSRSMPAPPPHILPQSFLPPPSTEYILPILPQRHAGYALETLSDAAFSLTTSANQPPPPRDPEDLRPVKPTITRINPASIPHVEGILPQYPPGYVPKDIETYVIAPHQVPDMSLPPLPPAEPTTGSLEQYRTVAAARPKSKPRRKRFGEMPEEGDSLSDGPLRNLTLKGPTSPTQARAAPDWQEVSRRMLHPRSLYSPPSPPRLPLPRLEGQRSRRSSRSAANSRGSSKSDSQPEPRSSSQNDVRGSQPMIQTQRSALDLELAPPMVKDTSMTTIRTSSTQDTVLASPMMPPRPELGTRSLSFQLPAPILGSGIMVPESLPPLEAATGLKRRWSEDEGASKREKGDVNSSPMGKSGTYWKTGQ